MDNEQQTETQEVLLVDIKGAAQMLGGLSERTVWANSEPRGEIPVMRIGKRVLYPVDGLRRYASKCLD